MKDMYGMGFDPRLFTLSAFAASYALELHRWSDAAQLTPVSGAGDVNQAATYTARAIGAARSANVAQAQKEIAQLEANQKKLAANKKKERGEYEDVTDELTVAKAWLAYAEGKHDDAVRLLRTVADKEEGEAEASQGIPAHEMVGDMLLESGHREEALSEYEITLKTNPGRFNSLYGAAEAAERAGKPDKAGAYCSELVKNCDGSKSERSELKHARDIMEREARAVGQSSTSPSN